MATESASPKPPSYIHGRVSARKTTPAKAAIQASCLLALLEDPSRRDQTQR
ncbi:MAG: hypothetical protein QM820_03145 [Minicystis sp.]